MLKRRETTLDWMREQVDRVVPLSHELQRIKALFPEQGILEKARPFYDLDTGRPSEDPILLTKIMFLSFFYAVKGDENTLETVTSRWMPHFLTAVPL